MLENVPIGVCEKSGIEIVSASTFVRDTVLEWVQAKMLDLPEPKTA